MKSLCPAFVVTFLWTSSVFGNGFLEVRAPGYPFRNADYSTTHVFVDEVAGTSADIEILYTLTGFTNITDVEVFTNLNRRDLARADKNSDGIPDGIVPIPGDDITDAAADTDPVTGHYYRVHNMTDVDENGIWELTLPASKTGAYRLTARFKTSDAIAENGNDPNTWIWWGQRDHAIVVAPTIARDVQLYVMNVFNVEASGDTFEQRSTLEDLHNADGAAHNANNRWDLDYLLGLGMDWLWFQPIHPNGIDGREPSGGYDTATPLYQPGSPYAVKNFFEVNALMTVDYDGNKTTFNGNPIDPTLHPDNRAAAMTAFQNFAAEADTKGVGLMLDAPFNHTAFDVELAQIGVDLFQPEGQVWDPLDEIRNRVPQFFSRDYNPAVSGSVDDPDTPGNEFVDGGENYGDRATTASDVAAGPDRFDFGKWRDVKDVYFGRYDSLVEFNDPERIEVFSYTSEGDWFDFTDAEWTSADFTQNGQSWNVTHRVWDYFAEYAVFWLQQTRPAGENRNSATESGLNQQERYDWDARGIDGLRCDFGQGLPPRAWEYMINVARSHKWSFVMMSESLDGGNVTYRSSRHFEILNENIVFPLKSAGNAQDYRNIFEGRRSAYGQALVLLNSTSHDEENYADPWQAVVRNAVTGAMDGATLIFPGMELGISTDNKGNSDPTDNFNFGYDHYEVNFGKTIPHFKRWNSMMPAWNDTNFGNDQLYPVFSGIQTARRNSPALKSPNRWFLDGDGGNNQIFAVAKYETPNASPAAGDVVLAFANLDRDTPQSDNFKIPSALADLLGLEDGRLYNAKNIAAYTAQQPNRRDLWLWGNGYTGADLETTGLFVELNDVPTANSDWIAEPYEAQYLKVYDVTAPTGVPAAPAATAKPYSVGTEAVFQWTPVAAEAGVEPAYEVEVTGTDSGGGVIQQTEVLSGPEYRYTGSIGDTVQITVRAVNPHFPANKAPDAGPVSTAVVLLDPDGDEDEDGRSNQEEEAAGTNPDDAGSLFQVVDPVSTASGMAFDVEVVEDYYYTVESTTELTDAESWSAEGDEFQADATGRVDFLDPDPGAEPKYYRVRVSSVPLTP